MRMHKNGGMLPIVFFALTFFLLQFAWDQCRGSAAEVWIIDRATVQPAVWLANHLWPELPVFAAGKSMISGQTRLNVLNGCEGLETLFLLVAAFVAYPLPTKIRCIGIVTGTALVYVLNQGRIVSLWWAAGHNQDLFAPLHGIILPLLLIALAFAFFVALLPRKLD